jgi:transcription-repair coupling factor (superfamily II helicase)
MTERGVSVLTVYGAPEGQDARLIAARAAETGGAVLHVARDDARMARVAEALGFFAPGLEVLRFPAWDCLPYDRVSPNAALVAERMATLARLAEGIAGPFVVLTTINALVQRVVPRHVFAGASMVLAKGGSVRPEELARRLEAQGYARAGTVMEPGDYALRGGIVDLFPAGAEEPVRLDLFGDEIESIRRFDPDTQRSGETVAGIVLRPVSEVPLDKDSISRFRSGWRAHAGASASSDPIYLSLSEGRRHPGMEHFLPLFFERMETLADYLPDARLSLDEQWDASVEARFEMIADHHEARRAVPRDGELAYRPLAATALYLARAEWDALLASHQATTFTAFARPDGAAGVEAGARPGPLFSAAAAGSGADAIASFTEAASRWLRDGRHVALAAWSQGSRDRLAHILGERGLATAAVATAEAIGAVPKGTIAIATLGLDRGFVAGDLAIVAEQDLLGERIARPPRRRRRADQFIAEASEIEIGDLVVHEDHGIGRYDGLVTLTVSGAPHDCLRIHYDDDGKLFLPVENIEALSRYGAEGAGVALDKLGGASWQARKARMKSRIRDMAAELIRTAAQRQLHEAALMAPPEGAWDEFCARFPFAETEDQARAIADVLEDLASGHPMDRLICGDVGFGKTEVALRAAFVAAMSGSQVAIVVPTTLLARQHYRVFSARFQGLPVTVAQLSRMVTAKEAAAVKAGIADGTINIVVGTHALLAKGVAFADLGLLIVDEEQHFGVAHKEKLKALRADIHVLTLTATPIPRTLQMSLSGVREMSLIATPPVDRLAVRTFIGPFDALVIREAIQRERFRGGQVFCVCPRIEDLPRMAERLREISPDARVIEAHGRLAPTELERVMTEFGDGRYDILLSTNIVESGLDMPAVNTLIIHRADRFGLGQLYQLRGRVGRGKQRGYAYLTWPPTQPLSATAKKRLDVMETLDTLGAGFTLASHDLDIRGAGNLLGDAQSGHIREVGIELYQQMLEDAVLELRHEGKGRVAERDWTPSIALGLPVLIPETYVRDLPVRLGLYRRIASLASDAESEAMAAEMVDRFGALPEEVENLLTVVGLKRLCREADVEKLEAGPKGMVIGFRRNVFRNPAGLVAWLATPGARGGGLVKLRPDHKLAMVRDMTLTQRLRAAREVLSALAAIADEAKAA